MDLVVKACCVLHDMVELRRGYQGTKKFRIALEDAKTQVRPMCWRMSSLPGQGGSRLSFGDGRRTLCGLDSAREHESLRDALIAHIWNSCGEADGNNSNSDGIIV